MFISHQAEMRVIGVGGGGGNTLHELRRCAPDGVSLVAVNTDQQALQHHPREQRLMIGRRLTRGLGAGGDPSVAFQAAYDVRHEIEALVAEQDLVFVTAGLGGGTGSGAAPFVSRMARDAGALTVGVVTFPFSFEGQRRRRCAMRALDAMRQEVDSLLVVSNDHLLDSLSENVSYLEAFEAADQVVSDAVRGISELVLRPGLINLDFADVKTILAHGDRAVMGVGVGRGPDRALAAIRSAMHSPLLQNDSIDGARGLLVSFTVDSKLGLSKIQEAVQAVSSAVDIEAEVLFGVGVDAALEDEVQVTFLAAGLSFDDPAPLNQSKPVTSSKFDDILSRRKALPSIEQVLTRPRRRNALVMLDEG